MGSASIRFAALAVLFLFLSRAALSAEERIFRLRDNPPVEVIVVGELTDPKGKGKKFIGDGEVVLDDGRKIAVGVVLKYKAKNKKSTFILKSPKGAVPKIKVTIKTVGDPEVITFIKYLLKDVDKKKSKAKEKDATGVKVVEMQSVDTALSDQRTLEGVKLLLAKEDDFPGAITKFNQAIDADYGNPNPVFFRALAALFDFLDKTQNSTNGTVMDMFARSGITNSATNFWYPDLVEEDLLEGQVPDAVPTADEIVDFFRDELVVEIEKFLTATASTPTTFEYQMSFIDKEGDFFDGDALDDVETVWLDYGDVQVFRAFLQVTLAVLDFFHAYELDNLDVDDFDSDDHPGVQVLSLLETDYPQAGKLVRSNMLTDARDHLKDALASYKTAATAILGETAAQRSNGLVTPYRTALRGSALFDTEADRTAFLTEEASFRTWAQGIVDQFEVDAAYTITTLPDGTTIPVEQRATVNFAEFFRGVKARTLYFKTIEDPRTGELEFGVEDIDDVVAGMYTADGVIGKLNDTAPGPADLLGGKSPLLKLRIASVPTNTKTVDGSLTEWKFGTNCVQIVAPPTVVYRGPQADFGEVWISKDATNLYLAHTADASDFSELSIELESDNGGAYIDLDWVWGSATDPTAVAGVNGTEVAVPLANFGTDQWVEIWIAGTIADPKTRVNIGSIFVKVR